MTALRATLEKIAPAPGIGDARPDGPLLRDLAAWVTFPYTHPGTVLGPFPILLTSATALGDFSDYGDRPATVDELAALQSGYGRHVIALLVDAGRFPDDVVILVGLVTPSAPP